MNYEPPVKIDPSAGLEEDSRETVKFSIPTATDAAGAVTDSIKILMPYYRDTNGPPEAFLSFCMRFERLRVAKDWDTTPATLFNVARILFCDTALMKWQEHVANAPNQNTVVAFNDCLDQMAVTVMRVRAATRQKRYLRNAKKPREMLIKDFLTRIQTINSYIRFMPGADVDPVLSEAELTNILESAVPREWIEKFWESHDPQAVYTTRDLQNYFEVLELAEGRRYPSRPNSQSSTRAPRRTPFGVGSASRTWGRNGSNTPRSNQVRFDSARTYADPRGGGSRFSGTPWRQGRSPYEGGRGAFGRGNFGRGASSNGRPAYGNASPGSNPGRTPGQGFQGRQPWNAGRSPQPARGYYGARRQLDYGNREENHHLQAAENQDIPP
jgi:hypothetical protein